MKKAALVAVDTLSQSAVSVKDEEIDYFYNPWHYHTALELSYIIKGTGTRYVGTSIERFGPEDMVFLGKEVPHLWKSDFDYYQNNPLCKSRAITIKFSDNFAGYDFLNLPETSNIKTILAEACAGLKITGKTKNQIASLLLEMKNLSPLDKIISVIQILNIISNSSEVKQLDPHSLVSRFERKEIYRLNKIIEYTVNNYNTSIELSDIAEVAGLSPASFCRFFKQTTKRTYKQFLNEVRVEHACLLLSQEKFNISEICFEVGFNNPSVFSMIFKRLKSIKPLEFRKRILSET